MTNTRRIENLVQGVSQQAAQQRRDSQHEAQFDCFNSPKDGCASRNSLEFISRIAAQHPGAFWYEIFRGVSEHYLALLDQGEVKVFNLEDGAACTVTDVSGAGYRALVGTGLTDRDNWVGQTVDDFTYFANKTRKPAMAGTLSPTRPTEAMFFVKGSGYLAQYIIQLTYLGLTHRWAYRTPDNSVAANGQYIGTEKVAAALATAMNGGVLPGGPGVGAGGDGDPGGGSGSGVTSSIVSTGALPAGFEIELNGNLIRIWRDDGADFEVSMSDSVGDTFTEAFKDTARSFTVLPKSGFVGFTLKVSGLKNDQADDFYVRYTAADNGGGVWQETVGPGVPTTIDPDTMPHALVNTGLNAFEWRRLSWSTRIAGDEDSAKDPRFIGRRIEDLFYNKKRLGILTEGACEWSKSQNPYTFFPDTVQTILASAPISIDISTGGAIALARKTIEVDEALYIWAQGVQFRVDAAQNEVFKQEAVEAPVSTFYEFAELANFGRAGTALYFATEPEEWVTLRQLVFQNTRPQGDVDVTAHVSEFIPAGVRRLSTSDTLRCLMVQTDGASNTLFLYNYLLQERNIVQSAWNPWRLPSGTILWSSIYKASLFVALQRADGVHLLRCSLRASTVDPGGEYHTTADLRVDESRVTLAHDPLSDETEITLPYALTEDISKLRVVCRTSGGGSVRGRHFQVLRKEAGGTVLVVQGDLTDLEFYVGIVRRAEAVLSEFFLRDENGVIDTDGLTVTSVRIYHDKTVAYRVEADIGAGRTYVSEMEGRTIDNFTGILDNPPGALRGTLDVSVNAPSHRAKITLINDSVFPSRWQSAVFSYAAVITRKPTK